MKNLNAGARSTKLPGVSMLPPVQPEPEPQAQLQESGRVIEALWTYAEGMVLARSEEDRELALESLALSMADQPGFLGRLAELGLGPKLREWGLLQPVPELELPEDLPEDLEL